MPRFDGTGPEGKGPNTGRGMGPCNQNKNKAAGRPMAGRRRGFGRGAGRGAGMGRAGR
jgi:hypothetical protein